MVKNGGGLAKEGAICNCLDLAKSRIIATYGACGDKVDQEWQRSE